VAERGIGRGLAAILPSTPRADELERVPVDAIRANRRQPRKSFDEEALVALAASIKEHGVVSPVIVSALPGGGYELIAGERRLRAARLAGLAEVPAVVRSSGDAQRLELALVENMAREDLSPIEAARGCAALVDELGLTKEEVGRRVGKSRVAVSNLIRLLELPDEALAMLEAGELTEGHGRALLQAPGVPLQRRLAREARDRGLSVRETEALARSVATARPALRAVEPPDADANAARREAEEALTAALGVEVHVRLKRRGCALEVQLEDLSEARELARRISSHRAV
jgi:ParB family transcriptional regulator, chromosome partitioning protein